MCIRDRGECIRILGKGENQTDLTVQLRRLTDPEKETIFENCVADVNIPVGEVFTSPVLEGTNGVLHVGCVYLNELQYLNLKITFKDGMITDYTCTNFENEEDNSTYIYENILHNHKTLPLGEFAIGTNTTAYVAAKKYGIDVYKRQALSGFFSCRIFSGACSSISLLRMYIWSGTSSLKIPDRCFSRFSKRWNLSATCKQSGRISLMAAAYELARSRETSFTFSWFLSHSLNFFPSRPSRLSLIHI